MVTYSQPLSQQQIVYYTDSENDLDEDEQLIHDVENGVLM